MKMEKKGIDWGYGFYKKGKFTCTLSFEGDATLLFAATGVELSEYMPCAHKIGN